MAPLVRFLTIFVAVSVVAPVAGFLAAPDGGPVDVFDIAADEAGAAVVAPVATRLSESPSLAPESGWWWNPDEPGRGFIIDRSGGQIVIGALAYEPDGRASWSLAAGALGCGNEFHGALVAFGGGQTLNGRFRRVTSQREVGRIGIRFLSPSQATLTLPNGRLVPLERYRLEAGARTDFEPEAGWWWNPAEPGRGFAVEAKRGMLLLTGVMYDERGNPVWYVAHGQIGADRSYRGRWLRLDGGMTMESAYRAAAATDAGAVSLDFVDARRATLTLPDGRALPLSRTDGASAPLALPVSAGPPRGCDDAIRLASVTG